jgi:manganese transport protein
MLFGIPLVWGVIFTAADVLLILLLQQRGFRWLEAFIISLIRDHRHLLRRRTRAG